MRGKTAQLGIERKCISEHRACLIGRMIRREIGQGSEDELRGMLGLLVWYCFIVR